MNFTKQGDADHLPGFVVKRAGEAGEGPKLDYEELRSGILRFTSEWRRKAEDKIQERFLVAVSRAEPRNVARSE
jgi:hypothetical protein